MAESRELIIAKILLKQILFAYDTANADTIWRSQHAEVRELWRRRADNVVADLDRAGYRIIDTSL